ncbi:MAG: phage portal protein [Pseudomonadota bacterium]
MKFWPAIFGSADDAPKRDASDDFWFGQIGLAGAAGEAVTVDRALQLPVVKNCIEILSGATSSLPSGVVRSERRGVQLRAEPEPEHPISLLIADPNTEQSGPEFLSQMVFDLATAGDFVAEIVPKSGGLWELRHLPADVVTVERLKDGSRRWRVRDGGHAERSLVEGEVWHVRKPPIRDGLTGLGAIEAGREEISKGLALQAYAARFFRNDLTPPLALLKEGGFADDNSKKNFLRAITRALTGKNRHKPMLLEHGIKPFRLGVNNNEAQFLETAKANDLALTRLWNMPAHKVSIFDGATRSNVEQQALEFVTDALMPWLCLIEASIGKVLMRGQAGRRFEFNVAGLLRGDIKTRYLSYAVARQWGWLSVNDIRAIESMNPVAGGNVYLQPMNMEPAGSNAGIDRANNQRAAIGEFGGPAFDPGRAMVVLHETVDNEGMSRWAV